MQIFLFPFQRPRAFLLNERQQQTTLPRDRRYGRATREQETRDHSPPHPSVPPVTSCETPDQRPPEDTRNGTQQLPASPGSRRHRRDTEIRNHSNQQPLAPNRMRFGTSYTDIRGDNPPPYEIVSLRLEENPLGADLLPPSYEEIMMDSFTEIRTEMIAECVNQRQEHSKDPQDFLEPTEV